jgi:glutamine synthetase
MLTAGLDGIRRQLEIPEASEENIYVGNDDHRKSSKYLLPGSPDEAISELEKDPVVREALGAQIFERFVTAKRLEWTDCRLEVTPWELEKYPPT